GKEGRDEEGRDEGWRDEKGREEVIGLHRHRNGARGAPFFCAAWHACADGSLCGTSNRGLPRRAWQWRIRPPIDQNGSKRTETGKNGRAVSVLGGFAWISSCSS